MAGPFYFAWVSAGTAFDRTVHNVEDEQVFSLTVEQSEGDFASLEIEIRNPRVGLLTPTRKTWAWLSWDSGSAIKPLFLGRLVGIPTSINQEIVTLVFTARPIDYVAQKAALAQSLKVFPFYDPVWIATDKLSDPDTVLEAYSALWHIDRVTHEVTVSDILVGENTSVVTDEVLDSVAKRDAKAIIVAINDERLRFLKSLKTWPVFGAGWNRRVAEVRAFSLRLTDHPIAAQAPKPLLRPTEAAPAKGVVPAAKAMKVVISQGVPAGGAASGLASWDWLVAHPYETAGIILVGAGAIGGAVYALNRWHQARQEAPTPGLIPVAV